MTHTIDDQLLYQLSGYVTARFGLHFPKKRWRDLERGITGAAADFGFDDIASCIRWLLTAQLTKSQLDILVCRLTIGETYFFRERQSFDALEAQILPALISSRRVNDKRLRIWSAGCSTGEEAYSIAILLHRLLADLPQWNITILATDVNPDSLSKAARGEYGDWSFRGIPHWIKQRFFTRNAAGRFEVADTIRKMVTFADLNLANDPFPSLSNNTNAMDIIFCRNVLMYFAPHQAKKVIDNFHHSLMPGGLLAVSPCETSHVLFRQYETVSLHDAVFYRKDHQLNSLPVPPSLDLNTGASILLPFRQAVAWEMHHPDSTQRPARQLPAPPIVPPAAKPVAVDFDEALVLYGQGLYAEAAAHLTRMLTKGDESANFPALGNAAMLLVRTLANQGEFTAALAWSEKTVAVNKLDPELRYLRAIILQEQGDIARAVAALKQTLYLDQNFVLAHFALANLLQGLGKIKEASKHLENAASLLASYGDDAILPGSEGLSARRLGEVIAATMTKAAAR
jgi:chemotaxis protein methyltransferase CheR